MSKPSLRWKRRSFLSGIALGGAALASSSAKAASGSPWSVEVTPRATPGSKLVDQARVSVERFDVSGVRRPPAVELELTGGPEAVHGFTAFVWDGDDVAGPSRPVQFTAAVYDDVGGLELTLVVAGRHRLPLTLASEGRYAVTLRDSRGRAVGTFELDVAR